MNYIIYSQHKDGRVYAPVIVQSITDVQYHLQVQTWLHGKLECYLNGHFFIGDLAFIVEALSYDVVRQESMNERAN